jgi:succinate-semialdehyde dehydrogenase/glutarate-semialdehyde dehydrogenase
MPERLNRPDLLRQHCLIDGAWLAAQSAQFITVYNPATADIIGKVPAMGPAETRRAISAAEAAWPAWRRRSAVERGKVLRRWSELMLANREDLARLMTLEQGKPLAEAQAEIAYAAAYLDWFGEEARRAYGEIVPSNQASSRILVTREPVGVCAAITPWNFPAAMITRKAGAALAAGCTMVLKPASQTPFSALALAVLAEDAGVPPGVFNLVTGSAAPIGEEFCANPKVRKLSFTGSTAVGARLIAQSAPSIKKLSMELGGNAPFIVFDDADIDLAVQGALTSKFRNSGQTCVCANRILVQDTVYEEFAARFVQAVQSMRVGNGLEDGVSQGPLIDQSAVRKVEALIADAIAQGARILTGGHPHVRGGNFFTPTVLGEAHPNMRLAREEIFGPVAPLFRFSTEAEAIRLANDTEFGLAAYFYARDVTRVFRVSEALEYGMVGVNTGVISAENAPFGGIKSSGLGREGSRHGLDDYLELKYLNLGGI